MFQWKFTIYLQLQSLPELTVLPPTSRTICTLFFQEEVPFMPSLAPIPPMPHSWKEQADITELASNFKTVEFVKPPDNMFQIT
jgi:hypothetical protein